MKKHNFGAFVALIGVAVNLGLFFVKFYIANSCNSLSIYLDSVNNAVDSVVCVAAALGFILAKKNKTALYPFGFGRTEGVVNFLISVIILITGLSFGYTSLGRIMYPLPIWFSVKYAAVIILTVPVKLLLLAFYRRSNRKLGSAVLNSLSLDSLLDFFITLCSFAALTLSNFAGVSVDGFAGFGISIILVIQGIKAVKESFGVLIGKRDNELCQRIYEAICFDANLTAVKSVECHAYGERIIANITVDAAEGCLCEKAIDEIKEKIVPSLATDVYINFGGNYGTD